jgi:DNA-binding FadR family transcriptional regulator
MTTESDEHEGFVAFERVGDDQKLFKKVVEQIERSIVEHELKPGDMLPPERVMTQQFGVSRTVIREAIKALELQGSVEVQHGRGAIVSGASATNVSDSLVRYVRIQESSVWALHELRTILETEIAALAAERCTEEDIQEIDAIIKRMSAKMFSPTEYVELDLDFHRAIVNAAHNPLFPLVLDPFMTLMRESRRLGASVDGAPQRTIHAHMNILECIKRRDPKAARNAMKEHCALVAGFIEKGSSQSERPTKAATTKRSQRSARQ